MGQRKYKISEKSKFIHYAFDSNQSKVTEKRMSAFSELTDMKKVYIFFANANAKDIF